MADKFLNNTGLEYYHNRAKTIFENKIEAIKVNGTEQTITNKEVNIPVPRVSCADGSDNKTELVIIKNNTNDDGISFTRGTDTVAVKFGEGRQETVTVDLASKDYVDGKGSVEIDSSLNNKTTFTNGTNTSSLQTSPDGIIYTEGATATEVPSKAYVDDAIADITGMEFVLVDTLPAEGEKGKIYLVPNNTAGSNIYDEYIWVQDGANGRFEKIGSTDVDLTEYWAKSELEAITTAEIDTLFA